MPTTFRADVVEAIVAILNDQKAATPDHLRKVLSARPGSFKELPCAYVGPRSESVVHDSGTRTRQFTGLTFVVVDTLQDNDQTSLRLDELVDYLVDRFDLPGNFNRIPGTLIEVTGTADTEVVVSQGERPDTIYAGVVFSLARTAIKEGRQ